MIRAHLLHRLCQFRRDEAGSTLVELALVLPLFLLLAFGLIDFGRLGFSYVMAQKATERAVREAVVRTPICGTLPTVITRAEATLADVLYGTSCTAVVGLCFDPGPMTCTADQGTQTGLDIFADIRALLPTNATTQNLRFSYDYDPNLGFLGGPYTPVVTVDIVDLDFEFVTPIGAFARFFGGNTGSTDNTLGNDFTFPSMSSSLPAEILMDGENA